VEEKNRVKCRWQAVELNSKTVEYRFDRGKKQYEGFGFLSASDLGDGYITVSIADPFNVAPPIDLVQEEASLIDSHPGKYRFSIFSRR
jgi:hypothetical protein